MPFLSELSVFPPVSCHLFQAPKQKDAEELTSWLFWIKFFTELPKMIEILRQRKLIQGFYFFSELTGDISFTGFTFLHFNGLVTLKIGRQNFSSPKGTSTTLLAYQLLPIVG